MTEAEWLTDTNGAELAWWFRERFDERKARLLMLGCCRRRGSHFTDPLLHEAVSALAAHYADPGADDEPFDRAEHHALYARLGGHHEDDPTDPRPRVWRAVATAARPSRPLARDRDQLGLAVWNCVLGCSIEGEEDDEDGLWVAPGEREAQAALVREVVGNPFRPVAFAPEWRTDTALALARQMYASEDFSAAPVLADALQDAGCDSDALLNHLRDPNTAHVRGCWALDLVLGYG